ncbi:conserved hypothetical protein [Rippkaea orientalis PCC 8801]|uniref:RNase H type-1 domain-containing protein n=1 Tax=Rippkaea orientalis (strain PCC 8801 / RF-1) TaxID=41431 RepID=B7K3P7_RIPO1|nr:ribonuclease HI family protein [Rippkaea orientalis]ACK65389.1 conserved hypothetical protein [Rippkaea orientalis PCC 8801]
MSNDQNSQLIIAKNTPIMFFDGESQGKSEEGAAAAVLLISDGRKYAVSQLVSCESDDEAEYMGLIIGLKKAQKLGMTSLKIKGDSEVVFNQVNGLKPVREDRLIRLYRKVIKLMQGFERISLEWITPENNRMARSVVQRCIQDALNKPSSSTNTAQAITKLIEKGVNCQDQDYHQLTASPDQWTHQSLSQLRENIPLEVRDAIALQWQGGEENLAQMYRWYLRGLPPEMASRKVNLEYKTNPSIVEKLPWEEALIVSPSSQTPVPETEDLLVSLVSNIDIDFDPLEHFLSHSIILEPTESFPEQDTRLQTSPDPLEILILEKPPETNQSIELIDFAEINLDEMQPLEELLGESLLSHETDLSKDTLPSKSTITEIIEMIHHLSMVEKQALAEELVTFPELINLILKAIADKVSQGKP